MADQILAKEMGSAPWKYGLSHTDAGMIIQGNVLFKPSLVHFDNVSKRAWLRLVLKLSKNSMTFVVPMVGSFQSNA